MEYNSYVGVRFKNVGKMYYFATNLELEVGDKVVVETVRGLEMGEIVKQNKPLSDLSLDTELKAILRKATVEDLEKAKNNKQKAMESLEVCKEIIKRHKLDMRLVNCEYTLDASKVIFMYVSDDRVDFRELLKELASVFKCRIELRQIGPRDKAKIVGGLGSCGLPLCCSSFLSEFDGVSINMAKNQMLAINIEKISGVCGRLMCCLKYEDDMYTKEKVRFPKIGTRVLYEDKSYRVTGINVLNDNIKIEGNGNILFVDVHQVKKEHVKKDEAK